MKTVHLTTNQIITCIHLIEYPDKGYPLKDIRLIGKYIKSLKSFLPEKPTNHDTSNLSEQETQEKMKFYQDELQKQKTTPIEISLDDFCFIMIKNKLSSFKGFSPAEQSRNDLINLSDQFEIV